ncbi:MAG TPA: TetR/AcrR family transcriptional regulator [Verrucomicrobiales bacterium]|nr:TetR/AcrR family transcriptional regulator [Verrucomicrobiales bacterium]
MRSNTQLNGSTRERILGTAYQEFRQHGFQGGSINRIVASAGITKGALFHHFSGKNELGYHVVDEVIRPRVEEKWIEPLKRTDDPIRTLRQILYKAAETARVDLCQGCPLNNLSQEMSPLDEGFRTRINAIYDAQRTAIEAAFRRGIAAGLVRKSVNPERAAAFIVAALTGMTGTAKTAQCRELLMMASEGLIDYLDSLKP